MLVSTPDGLRCSVNTSDVRPFWGLAGIYVGGALLAVYLAAVLAVFALLRGVGYPVSIVHIGLPPMWHRVGEARGWFFLNRSQQAFAAGRTNEGMLYLTNAYEFDPRNYRAGLALAQHTQLPNPPRSDQIFQRLLNDHPAEREATAQQWYRALLARGDFERISELATSRVLADSPSANVWMRALVFASRHGGSEAHLNAIVSSPLPTARRWQPLVQTELLARAQRLADVRTAVTRPWAPDAPPYTILYRVEMLVRLGDPTAAMNLLLAQRPRLDDEAFFTLRLHCLASAGAYDTLRTEFDTVLLRPPLTQPILKIMCAQLIRHPDRILFDKVLAKVEAAGMPFNDSTAGGWFSLLCTAGVAGDEAQLRALASRIGNLAPAPFAALPMIESFFRGRMAERRATAFLPLLPMPIEVTYAMIDRFPGSRLTDTAADAGR
ncbi:hypothetical protein DB354_02880 [Opitutus sp. ER46]|nr:hypothetical protein DB354_02880 [Opitutus sp. ER46]